MTILSSNEIPLGLRGLAIFLIGIGSLWVVVFVGQITFYFEASAGEYYWFDSSKSTEYLIPILFNLLLGVLALVAAYALFLQKKIARILAITYGILSLSGLANIGHPVMLFGIMGAVILYYLWQPHVREYFQNS